MMPSTVPKEFDEFEAELRPTENQKVTIASPRSVTARYLSQPFGSGSCMELLSTKVIGSAGLEALAGHRVPWGELYVT
jgi:hypothetical protein